MERSEGGSEGAEAGREEVDGGGGTTAFTRRDRTAEEVLREEAPQRARGARSGGSPEVSSRQQAAGPWACAATERSTHRDSS